MKIKLYFLLLVVLVVSCFLGYEKFYNDIRPQIYFAVEGIRSNFETKTLGFAVNFIDKNKQNVQKLIDQKKDETQNQTKAVVENIKNNPLVKEGQILAANTKRINLSKSEFITNLKFNNKGTNFLTLDPVEITFDGLTPGLEFKIYATDLVSEKYTIKNSDLILSLKNKDTIEFYGGKVFEGNPLKIVFEDKKVTVKELQITPVLEIKNAYQAYKGTYEGEIVYSDIN